MRRKVALQRLFTLLGLLILWELVARFGPWPHYLFPGPFKVFKSLGEMAADGRLSAGVLRSMSRLGYGYLISVAIGLPLGVAMARISFFRLALKPILMGLQALPSICWLPLALLWFGLSDAAILFVVVMGSVLAVAIATEDGVNGVQPQLLQAAGTLGIKGIRLYGGVLLPAALPGILTGLKLGWSFAWRALMAGELLYVSGGLGQLLTVGRELMDVSQVMAVMLTIVAVGYLVDRVLFQKIEFKIRKRWGLVPE